MGKKEPKKAIRDELKAIAPQLAKWKDQSAPVDIPTGYFDQLADDVFQKIREEETVRNPAPMAPRQPWWMVLQGFFQRPAYALAGVLILLVSIAVFQFRGQPEVAPNLTMSEEDINDYINFHIDDFDLSLLAEETQEVSPERPLIIEGDSLDKEAMDEYFDEWLDEIELEDLL